MHVRYRAAAQELRARGIAPGAVAEFSRKLDMDEAAAMRIVVLKKIAFSEFPWARRARRTLRRSRQCEH